jgi:hypothetical protein
MHKRHLFNPGQRRHAYAVIKVDALTDHFGYTDAVQLQRRRVLCCTVY